MGLTGFDRMEYLCTCDWEDDALHPKYWYHLINANEVNSNEDVVAMDSLLAEAKVIALAPRAKVALAA